MTQRQFFAFYAFLSICFLGTALFFQYVFDMQPCSLCIYQRYPWLMVAILGLLGFSLSSKAAYRFLTALIFIALLLGAAIAFYHFGVEQKWWNDHFICESRIDTENYETFKQQLLATKTVDCSKVQWSLFGISMTGYNAIISFFLAVIAGLKWRNL